MPGAINIVICHPARIVAVGLPKCGSSTMVETFLRMSGFDPKPRKVRDMAVRLRKSGELAAAGMEFLQCEPDEIVRQVAANPGYRTFSIIRDPYTRIYSAYFNKLNRYTKAYRPDLYRKGQLARLLAGPKGWQRVEVGNRTVHPYLSFPAFLAELDRLGTAIDPHFDVQVRLLDYANVRYDRLLDIKDMDLGLPALLREFQVPEAMLTRVPSVSQANRTLPRSGAEAWRTPDEMRLIERLYAEDFAALGFPKLSEPV